MCWEGHPLASHESLVSGSLLVPAAFPLLQSLCLLPTFEGNEHTVAVVLGSCCLFFFLYFFTEVKFTYHRINNFEVNNSLAFSTFPTFYNYHSCLVSKHCRHPTRVKAFSPLAATPHVLSPGPWQPLICFSVSVDLPTWLIFIASKVGFIERCNLHTTNSAVVSLSRDEFGQESTVTWEDGRFCRPERLPAAGPPPAPRSLSATDLLSVTAVCSFCRISPKWHQSVMCSFIFSFFH